MTIYRDDLERVYALIEKPENWTQETWAKISPAGEAINPINANAQCWCIEGAFCKVLGHDPMADKNLKFRYEIANACNVINAGFFNDTHTHAEVLALLKTAIERAPVRP